MTINILLLAQEGCSPCKRVKRILNEIQNALGRQQIVVEEKSFASEQGMSLAREYQILYPPAVFIDGKLFAKGKISENDLKQAIRSSLGLSSSPANQGNATLES